jgi:glycosyltransferase involved in cell wall biosynthesis
MSAPRISVVVPVHNGAWSIDGCLESLLAMHDPPGGVEVIVVDNGSSDATADILRRHAVLIVCEPRRGAAAARNAGIRQARGEIIAFTDQDCIVARDWVQRIHETFVLGFADGINANAFAAVAQKKWEDFWFEETPQGLVTKRKGIDTRNCAIRKRVLDEQGGFDPEQLECEDLELSWRLERAGCEIVSNLAMRVRHRNPTSLRESLEKSRRRLTAIQELVRHPPEGMTREDMGFPTSAFHGLADRPLRGPALGAVLMALAWLRAATLAAVRLCLALRLHLGLTLKLYKVFVGVSYEMAALRARRPAP